MNIKKTYLTSNEINTIVNDMLAKETHLQRIISRDILILYFCTDLNIADENGVIDATFETYDKYKTDGTIKDVLSKIDEDDLLLIDECVYEEEKTSKVVKEFLDGLSKKVDEYGKNVDVGKLIDQLKGMVDKK